MGRILLRLERKIRRVNPFVEQYGVNHPFLHPQILGTGKPIHIFGLGQGWIEQTNLCKERAPHQERTRQHRHWGLGIMGMVERGRPAYTGFDHDLHPGQHIADGWILLQIAHLLL